VRALHLPSLWFERNRKLWSVCFPSTPTTRDRILLCTNQYYVESRKEDVRHIRGIGPLVSFLAFYSNDASSNLNSIVLNNTKYRQCKIIWFNFLGRVINVNICKSDPLLPDVGSSNSWEWRTLSFLHGAVHSLVVVVVVVVAGFCLLTCLNVTTPRVTRLGDFLTFRATLDWLASQYFARFAIYKSSQLI